MSDQVDVGRQCLRIHGEAWVRLEIPYGEEPPGYKPGYTGPGLEWVRSEIIGIEDEYLLVMLVDKPVVPHGYKQGQVLPVQFEQLGPTQTAIWLVPRKLIRGEAENGKTAKRK